MGYDDEIKKVIEDGRRSLEDLRSDHKRELNDLKLSHDKELGALRQSAYTRLDSEIAKIRSQATSVTVGVATLVVLGVLAFLYSGTKDVYAGMRDVNQAVVALQESLLSAQTTITTTNKDLADTAEAGKKAVAAAERDFKAARQILANSQQDLELASKRLSDTQRTYDERLRTLAPRPGEGR